MAPPSSSGASARHALFPDEALEEGGAHAVVAGGDGDQVWPEVLADCETATLKSHYDGGRIDGARFMPARWDLAPKGRYMWASVQTVRGCPKHCSFCSVWRTDGQTPRNRTVTDVMGEIVELRRRGFRFIALADDENFYPVSASGSGAGGTAERSDPPRRAAAPARRSVRADGVDLA